MHYLLDFPPAAERHKITLVSAYLKIAADKATRFTPRLVGSTPQGSNGVKNGCASSSYHYPKHFCEASS